MIYSTDQYYEAKVQLRPYNKEVLDYVKKAIDKNENVFISKEEKKKYGVDLLITSLKYAKILGSLLKKRFKGILKFSTTLYGMKDGKKVYRLTVLFKLEE